MTTHIDIAQRLLATTLHTGVTARTHGRHFADWLSEQIIDDDQGDAIALAVDLVTERLSAEMREWMDDLLFNAACEAKGRLGRRVDAARVAAAL